MSLTVGLCASVDLSVEPGDTALSIGSGDVDVLATPVLVALCERATVSVLAARLRPDQTSVGFRVEITHLVPVAVGGTVTAAATLERIEGKRLTFSVSVTDKCGLIAAGRVTRVLVDPGPFMDKAR